MKTEPKSIFRIRVRLMGEEELREVWRVFDIPSNRSLSTLQYAIAASFENNDDPKWSFFFGRPDKKNVIEYTAEVRDFRFLRRKAKSARPARPYTLPIKTCPDIFYLYARSPYESWWHRVEFVEEVPPEPGKKYPVVIERHGDTPVGRSRRLDKERGLHSQNTLEQDITFDELDAAMRGWPGCMKAAEVVGYLQGMLAAPNMVLPSEYVELFMGEEASGTTAEAMDVIRVILAMNNRIAGLVTGGQPVELRRTDYACTQDGVLEQIRDLKREMQGFRRGLDLGRADPDVLDADGKHAMDALIKADALLDSGELSVMQEQDVSSTTIAGHRQSLDGMASTISIIMRDLAQAFRRAADK